MAESSAAKGRPELKVEVADFLGKTRTSGNWSTEDEARINACVDNGVQQFYAPPQLPEQVQVGDPAHEWSFIKKPYNFDTTADDWDVDCPDDFGSMGDDFVYDATEGYMVLDHVAAWQILEARMIGSSTGRPSMYAVRWKACDGDPGQRAEWLFWHTPGGAYGLNCTYYVLQGVLTDDAPYPLGGAYHAQTIMASCMEYAARVYRPEQHPQMLGFWYDRLRSSIFHDLQSGWRTLGYNAAGPARRFRILHNTVTLEGNAP